MIEVVKKESTKTGKETGTFIYGYGYLSEKTTIKYKTWQVLVDGEKFCECNSERKAEVIAESLRFFNGEK